MFNSVLRAAGIETAQLRLVRHQDHQSLPGRTPYHLWRNDPAAFEAYQSLQSTQLRSRLQEASFWAVFVATPAGETLFVNLYCSKYAGLLKEDRPAPNRNGVDKAGSCDRYDLLKDDRLDEYSGRLVVSWGAGARAWVQRADRQDKPVLELRRAFAEPEFPGFLSLELNLSDLDSLSTSWITPLKAAKGIYLLTCPKTNELYVGKADGDGGFWQRWQDYLRTGHGGNVALKSRDPSNYRIAILEVSGTGTEPHALSAMEARWKRKLQSREYGLNRN